MIKLVRKHYINKTLNEETYIELQNKFNTCTEHFGAHSVKLNHFFKPITPLQAIATLEDAIHPKELKI
jgi:hypothetical protein